MKNTGNRERFNRRRVERTNILRFFDRKSEVGGKAGDDGKRAAKRDFFQNVFIIKRRSRYNKKKKKIVRYLVNLVLKTVVEICTY